MRLVRQLGAAFALLGIAGAVGCGSSPAGPGVGGANGGAGTNGGAGAGGGVPGSWLPTATTNDDANLSGMSVGLCDGSASLLRKKIPVTLTGGGTQFSIGDGYLMSDASIPAYAYFALPVTNVGTTMHCFVSASDYSWLDSAGNSEGSFLAYVTGSVGQVDPTIYTDTCLAPGETGFLLDIQSDLVSNDIYTPTTSVTLALSTSSDGTLPPAKVLPLGNTVAGAVLTVAFENEGTRPADIAESNSCPYILVDSGGLPVTWAFLDPTPLGELDVGQQGSATANYVMECGQTVRAYIPFQSPDQASGPTVPSAASDSVQAWRKLQAQQLAAARAALGRRRPK
jgi:hypothetical protein